MNSVKRAISALLVILMVFTVIPVAVLAAEDDGADFAYSETVSETEEAADGETDSAEVPEEDAAPGETEDDGPEVGETTEETVSDAEPAAEDVSPEEDAKETATEEDVSEEFADTDEDGEYVLISESSDEFFFNAPPSNSLYVSNSGISRARFYDGSSWRTIDPANGADRIQYVQIETNYAHFYLEYRVRTSEGVWCSTIRSDQAGTYAGRSGKTVANLEIKVFNRTRNAYDHSDYVIMYRAKVAGEWLSWVSNGNETAMRSIKKDFGLSGDLDFSATDSGWLSRGNITALQIMMFERRTHTAGSDAKIIKAPYINQFGAGLPNGCEATSAVMALKYAGVNIDTETFISKYLPMGAAPSGGVGADPNKVYVGDPHLTGGLGWGCYAPVIEGAMKKAADQNKYQIINETGKSLSTLCSTYINNNVPVVVWATVDMTPSVSYSYWTTPEGKSIKYNNKLHCLLLVGYDSNYYYFNDPMNRVGINDYFAYPRSDVEYAYSLMEKQAVVIRKIVCTGITLKSLPTRTAYYIGETFDKSGLVVNAAYSNGTNKNVTGYTVTGADTSTAGQKTVTVTWSDPLGGSFSKTFVITVVDPTSVLVSLDLASAPSRLFYYIGEEFDETGLSVEGTFEKTVIENGVPVKKVFTSLINTDSLTVSGFDSSSEGTVSVAISFGDLSCGFDVTIVDPTPVLKSIEVVSPPDKTEYDVGEEFDKTGLSVSATYEKNVIVEDGVEKAEESYDVLPEELTISGFDSSDEGICTVTVEFGGFETSFEVSVRKKVVVTRGDVDGNGSVNMKDLLLCRRLVAGDADESEIVVENTDLNGDGSINLKDILVLRKILAGEE